MEKLTEKSISSMTALIKAVKKIRKNRIAFDDEEALSGVFCVAAPVVNNKGECLAAISISTPKNRISRAKKQQFSKLIAATADKISKSLDMP